MRIKNKLVLSCMMLLILSTYIVAHYITMNSQNEIIKYVKDKNQTIVDSIHSSISIRNNLLNEKIFTDLFFADRLLVGKGNPRLVKGNLYYGNSLINNSRDVVDLIKVNTKAISSILIMEKDSLLRISSNAEEDPGKVIGTKIPDTSNIFKAIKKGKPYYGVTILNGTRYISGYKPLYMGKKIIGAISIGYPEFDSYLYVKINNTKIGATGQVYIIDSTGKSLLGKKGYSQKFLKKNLMSRILTSSYGSFEHTAEGTKLYTTYRYYKPLNIYVVATSNYKDLFSLSDTIIRPTFLVILITIVIGYLLSFISSTIITRPLEELTNCMMQAEDGNLSVECPIRGNDEIGSLAKVFNSMVKENKRLLDEKANYDRMKTEFMANMSHDLKTPIAIIFSTAQLFMHNVRNCSRIEDKSRAEHYYGIIKQNCYRLLRLVNNIIDITKIDTGYLSLTLRNVNIVELIEDTTLSTAEYIASKEKTIIFDTDIEERYMQVDIEKIERVLLNLISNAVKFTRPHDTIFVNIYDRGPYVRITVRDTGIGIPAHKQSMLFERFAQVTKKDSNNQHGSGIGLSLVKSLVEIHGGTVTFESVENEGTTFIIDLPAGEIPSYQGISDIKVASSINDELIDVELSDIDM